jgi:hypothetical protein
VPGSFTLAFLYMSGGLVVWAVRFLAVYIITALACAREWADVQMAGVPILPAALVAATFVGLAACGVLLVRSARALRAGGAEGAEGTSSFVHAVAALVAGLAALAMIWETLPVLFVPVCTA